MLLILFVPLGTIFRLLKGLMLQEVPLGTKSSYRETVAGNHVKLKKGYNIPSLWDLFLDFFGNDQYTVLTGQVYDFDTSLISQGILANLG